MENTINPVALQILISAISVIISAVVVFLTVSKGNASQAKETGKILASIEGMKEVLADLKATTRDVTTRVASLEARIASEETTIVLITSRLEALERKGEESKKYEN